MLSVVPQEIEFNLITVTGESLADEIDKTGKVAVYGIYFDSDSADIKPESKDTLAEISKLLALRPELALYVDGHTDNEGTEEYNQTLSGERAQAVVDALVAQFGITADRVASRGFGESKPVAANDSVEGRAWNRRVELVAR
jgi:outer membrane protein OmpA-like peptidoglycan-associated protein